MLQPVSVAHKHFCDYASIVGRPLISRRNFLTPRLVRGWPMLLDRIDA